MWLKRLFVWQFGCVFVLKRQLKVKVFHFPTIFLKKAIFNLHFSLKNANKLCLGNCEIWIHQCFLLIFICCSSIGFACNISFKHMRFVSMPWCYVHVSIDPARCCRIQLTSFDDAKPTFIAFSQPNMNGVQSSTNIGK